LTAAGLLYNSLSAGAGPPVLVTVQMYRSLPISLFAVFLIVSKICFVFPDRGGMPKTFPNECNDQISVDIFV
jgi:hypothetical protein